MALDLHADCKKRLREALAEAIPEIKVKNNMFIDRLTSWRLFLLEKIIPAGKIRQNLINWINEYPLFEFFYDNLYRTLVEKDAYERGDSLKAITDIEEFSNPADTASHIVDTLDTLPWQYKLSFELPNDLTKLFGPGETCQLSKTVSICNPDEEIKKNLPLAHPDEKKNKFITKPNLLLFPTELEWKNISYLQFDLEGFVDTYGTSSTILTANNLIKAFCGLGIALNIFRINRTYQRNAPKQSFFVHKKNKDSWEIDGKPELDDGISVTFNEIILQDLDGSDTEEKKIAVTKNQIPKLKSAFDESSNSERISLAAQWLFDSYSNRNELLSFVQAMVVLEILLGDKASSDEIGLGQLLRNRCAFLIGNSSNERSEILQKFDEIYSVRSQIVHRGKSRFTAKERYLSKYLQWMCSRAIQEELRLAGANEKKKN